MLGTRASMVSLYVLPKRMGIKRRLCGNFLCVWEKVHPLWEPVLGWEGAACMRALTSPDASHLRRLLLLARRAFFFVLGFLIPGTPLADATVMCSTDACYIGLCSSHL